MLQGLKLTKQSVWRSAPSWQAVSANRHPSAAHFMSNQQSLGLQLAQLSRDASAAVSFVFFLLKGIASFTPPSSTPLLRICISLY